jgi:hypothetical protein
MVHRFDSLAKVVVSPVFQGSVDGFQKRSPLDLRAIRRLVQPLFRFFFPSGGVRPMF